MTKKKITESGWGRNLNSRTFHFNVRQNSLQIKKKKKIIQKKKITERLEMSCDVFPKSLKKVHFLKTKNVNIL